MTGEAREAPPVTPERQRLVSWLEQEVGLDLREVDLDRVLALAEQRGGPGMSFSECCSAAAAMIAVHETYFLRHHSHFRWIRNEWLPSALARLRAGGTLRILSAGCSTGEEPYSLYACLQQSVEAAGMRLLVDAVDVNAHSIERARSGRYGLWSMRGVDLERERHWLTVVARNIYVREDIRDSVNFRQHNLMKPLPRDTSYHLILCRNVLIYMHRPAVERIYANLLGALAPEGLILPGPSDPTPQHGDLECLWHEGVRLYRRRETGHEQASLPAVAPPIERPAPVARPAPRAEAHRKTHALHQIEALIHAGEYTAARVLLHENLESNRFDVRSYVICGALCLDVDDLEGAREMLRKAIFIEPDCAYAAFLSADLKSRLGEAEGARRDLLWLREDLSRRPTEDRVRYCEEISVGQLRQVVDIRLKGNLSSTREIR